jgi:hypothetical protein
MGVETAPYGSFPLSTIQIAVTSDSNSLACSRASAFSIMPSPLVEERDESFAGAQNENNWSEVNVRGVNDPKHDDQNFIPSQEPKFQVEFKDQVFSNLRSQSVTAAHTYPSPPLELTESNEQHFHCQTVEQGVQSQPEAKEGGRDCSHSTLFIASPNHVAEGADSSMAGSTVVCEQSNEQDEGAAGSFRSPIASKGRSQHDINGSDDSATHVVDSLSNSEDSDKVSANSTFVNQQSELSDDSSDCASESPETRLRCYSI